MSYKTIDASNSEHVNELVNEQLSNLDANGKLQLPDDMPSEMKEIVRSHKRQRDAQSELSRVQKELRDSKATNKVLNDKQLVLPANLGLSQEEIVEINGLSTSNPEEYRKRMNAAEQSARVTAQAELDSGVTKSIEDANNAHITDNRVTVLQNFRQANPELVITDDVLVNDIPPRFMNDLTSGKYANYGEYLEAFNG